MLDFLLVLGQIPGTHIQINFWGLVIIVIATWLVIRFYRRPALRHKYCYLIRLTAFYIYHFRSLRRPQN
ncbi:MAG: hypothetical protein Q7R60_02195 [bacterium]|nr:hypothetical protein [bacterium]